MKKIKLLILDWTYPIWHPPLVKIICECQQKMIINNDQLHEILARFDRTQRSHYLMRKKAV